MAKRTKIEADINWDKRTTVIRELYVDSGKTKRVMLKLDWRNDSIEEMEAQVRGFLKAANENPVGRSLNLVLGRIYN